MVESHSANIPLPAAALLKANLCTGLPTVHMSILLQDVRFLTLKGPFIHNQ